MLGGRYENEVQVPRVELVRHAAALLVAHCGFALQRPIARERLRETSHFSCETGSAGRDWVAQAVFRS
jgi:hypothetical protein